MNRFYKVINMNDLFQLCAQRKCLESERDAQLYLDGLVSAFTSAEFRIGRTPDIYKLNSEAVQYLEVWPIGHGTYRIKYFFVSHDVRSHVLVEREVLDRFLSDIDCDYSIYTKNGILSDIEKDLVKEGYCLQSNFNEILLYEKVLDNGKIRQVFVI